MKLRNTPFICYGSDHLQVTIAEIGVTVETAPGKIDLADAERAATRAISQYVLAQREAAQVKAS